MLLQDRLNHACLIDGALLVRRTLRRYPHGDAAARREQLRGDHRTRRALLATDGVFSMDGDIAPLRRARAAPRACTTRG